MGKVLLVCKDQNPKLQGTETGDMGYEDEKVSEEVVIIIKVSEEVVIIIGIDGFVLEEDIEVATGHDDGVEEGGVLPGGGEGGGEGPA